VRKRGNLWRKLLRTYPVFVREFLLGGFQKPSIPQDLKLAVCIVGTLFLVLVWPMMPPL
jgi:hypothetical protein